MNRIARILCVLTVSIAFFGLAASAQAQSNVNHFNDRFDVPFTIIDCNGATLNTIGDVHIVIHSVLDDSGGVHMETHTNFDGKAISFVGGRPTLNIIHTAFHSSSNVVAATTSTQLLDTHVSSSNDADNTIIRLLLHTTTNANGEVTAVTAEGDSDCRG